MERFLEHTFPHPQLCLHLLTRRQHYDCWQYPDGIPPTSAQVIQEVCRLVRAEETQIEEQHHGDVSTGHGLVRPGEDSVPATTHRCAISRQLKCPAEQILDRRLILGDPDVRGSRGSVCPGMRLASACVANVPISSRHTDYFLFRITSAGPCREQRSSLWEERSPVREALPAVSRASAFASLE